MFEWINEYKELKRMDKIFDLIRDEKKKRADAQMEIIKTKSGLSEETFLYIPRFFCGYERDDRSFIRLLMPRYTNEEIVDIVMEHLDKQIRLGIDLMKTWHKIMP